MRASLRIILLVVFLSGICTAAQPSVHVTVLNTNARFRAGAPGNLHIQIENSASGLREGILETTVLADDEVLLSHETVLAVAPGKTRRMLFIPLLNTASAEMRVNFRFLNDGTSQDAGTHIFQRGYARDHLVLHAVTGKPDENQNRLARTMRGERIAPGSGARYVTNTEWLQPEDLPQTPVAYMAYDLVVLDHRALVSAKERALNALSRWVDAGGSVLVSPGQGVPLPEAAEKFLARLAMDDPVSDGTRWLAPGLGRAVIWREGPPVEGEMTVMWDKATAFLWRVNPPERTPEGRRGYANADPFGEIERTLVSSLGSNVSPLSFSVVAGCFVLFILATALFDYFVLGRRFRKYTWGIFPLQCAAFAWLMMAIANSRLGNIQRSASVEITDLGIDGRVLRRTKFVGILPGKTGAADYSAEGAYVRSVVVGEISTRQRVALTQRYTGKSMRVWREKWTPCFVRETSMPEGADPSGLQWQKWQIDQPEKSVSLVAGGAPGVDFAAQFTGSSSRFDPSEEWSRRWRPVSAESFIAESNSLSTAPFSQFAPLGGHDERDLIFPVEGTRRAVLVAVKTEGDTTSVYRRLYSMEARPE